jgi:hypothetical protein
VSYYCNGEESLGKMLPLASPYVLVFVQLLIVISISASFFIPSEKGRNSLSPFGLMGRCVNIPVITSALTPLSSYILLVLDFILDSFSKLLG